MKRIVEKVIGSIFLIEIYKRRAFVSLYKTKKITIKILSLLRILIFLIKQRFKRNRDLRSLYIFFFLFWGGVP